MSIFEVIRGVEGCCLALDDRRIAGPKPWGGGTVIHSWKTDEEYRAVVRCRDCINFSTDEIGDYCTLLDFEDIERMANGFCAWGKRKD